MSVAWAHSGDDHAGESFGWSFEPWVIGPLILFALLFMIGSNQIRQRGKADRRGSMILYWTGLVSIALALISPLHEYGEHVFTAHMIEHEILMVVGVPLIVASRPGAIFLWGMPEGARRFFTSLIRSRAIQSGWKGATDLGGATILHTAVLWLWHLRVLFQAALEHESMHIIQHLSFIISALFFWSALLTRDHRRYEQGLAALALFFTSLQAGFLGALITFSSRLWYPDGPDPFPVSGLTRAEDQILAGLIMWVPACSLYVVVALIILARWLQHSARLDEI
jgi:putative membrane protein